ncbi:hypothetical protein BDN67DRAFT_985674 [Paxillus ammoniavirescens]|nr:hypothetical protein BDN67DRAFT_985674 [Paxillus ammoniavirescens]
MCLLCKLLSPGGLWLSLAFLDAMHNLFLNELPHHCREVWDMNAGKKSTSQHEFHDPARQELELGKALGSEFSSEEGLCYGPHTLALIIAADGDIGGSMGRHGKDYYSVLDRQSTTKSWECWSHKEEQMLDNYIALVIAVRWATMRSTSQDHIKIVESSLHFYLTSLVQLYSKDILHPSHHLSQHLSKCIKLFGPVHGWWSFPFERFNGIIQQHHTNNKIGNLKGLLQTQTSLPAILAELKPLVHQHDSKNLFRSSLMSDLMALSGRHDNALPVTLLYDKPLKDFDQDIYKLLLALLNRRSPN